ncbi:MAG: hypothetical protein ACREUW_06415 [Burkholderiales bacterium]
MNKLDDPGDQECLIEAAQVFYVLYGNVFRELDAQRAGRHDRAAA